MNAGKLFVAITVCLWLAGCRNDPNIAVLERELRIQEDEINRLKWALEDSDTEIRSLQRENEGIRHGTVTQTPYPSSTPPLRSNGHSSRNHSDLPPGAVMEPPEVEVPKTFVPEGEIPETLRPRNQRNSSGERSVEPPRELPSIESGRRPAPATSDGPTLGGPHAGNNARRLPVVKGDSRQVAKIAVNPKLTGGFRAKGPKGDDGLAVVIEPRDAHGRLVEAAGDISVVVVDPSASGSTGRVGRWDFTAADAKQLFRNDAVQGIQLEVPWPDAPPKADKLQLYVRYKTADGRKLQTNQPIPVDMAANEPRRLPVGDLPSSDGPALLATRKPENWKTAAPTKPMPADIAPADGGLSDVAPTDMASRSRSLAERNSAQPGDEPAPLMASRPTPPSAPPKPKAPSLQRPVWSPERP